MVFQGGYGPPAVNGAKNDNSGSEQSIAYAAKTLQLVRVLKTAGGATKLEVAEAEQSPDGQKASQADLIEQRVELRNAQGVKLGARLKDLDDLPAACRTHVRLAESRGRTWAAWVAEGGRSLRGATTISRHPSVSMHVSCSSNGD
jgi:hypothetical protein